MMERCEIKKILTRVKREKNLAESLEKIIIFFFGWRRDDEETFVSKIRLRRYWTEVGLPSVTPIYFAR